MGNFCATERSGLLSFDLLRASFETGQGSLSDPAKKALHDLALAERDYLSEFIRATTGSLADIGQMKGPYADICARLTGDLPAKQKLAADSLGTAVPRAPSMLEAMCQLDNLFGNLEGIAQETTGADLETVFRDCADGLRLGLAWQRELAGHVLAALDSPEALAELRLRLKDPHKLNATVMNAALASLSPLPTVQAIVCWAAEMKKRL